MHINTFKVKIFFFSYPKFLGFFTSKDSWTSKNQTEEQEKNFNHQTFHLRNENTTNNLEKLSVVIYFQSTQEDTQ